MDYTLSELLNIPSLRLLLSSLDEINNITSAIVDVEGNILTANSWQDICAKFHRVNSETKMLCRESDLSIKARLADKNSYVAYQCHMGLVDAAMPIVIEGKYLGSVYVGQFFLEAPDEARFIEQAHQYGFNVTEYLTAMRKVQLYTEEQFRPKLLFIAKLTQMMAEKGLQLKRQLAAEDALLLNDMHHHSIIQTAMDGMWLVDSKMHFLEVNEAYCNMSGYSEQELLTMCIYDVEVKESPEISDNNFQHILANGKARYMSKHRRKDGTVYDVEVSTQRHPKGDGRLIAFLRDITEKLQAEKAVIDNEKKYRQLFHHQPTGFALHEIIVDANGKPYDYKFLEINPAFEVFTGLKASDIIGKTQLEIMPNSEPFWAEIYGNVALTGAFISFENFSVELNKYYQVNAYCPEPGKFATIFLDITERKQAEEALQQMNNEKTIILENATIGITYIQNRTHKWANPALCEMFGYTSDEIANMSVAVFYISQEDYNQVGQDAYKVLARGKTYSKTLQVQRKNGTIFQAYIAGKAVNPDDPSAGSIWIVTDETVRYDLENRLQQSHNLLKSLSNQIPGMIFQYQLFPDNHSCFPYVSDAICDIYEVTPEEVRVDATPVYNILHPDDYDETVESILLSARTLNPWEHVYRVKLPNQGERWRYGYAKPEKQDDGSILWHGFINDVTRQKEIELELDASLRSAESANRAKSEFLANMSHEIRTPMNGVIGIAQLLAMTDLNDDQKRYVDILNTSGKNLLELINEILDLSKIEAGMLNIEYGEFSLKHCINDVILLHKSTIYWKGLAIDVDINENIPVILKGDQHRIKQIVNNLLGNAVKFTSKGGITISVNILKQFDLSVHVSIEVCDTGTGISSESIENIFNPFCQADGTISRKYGGTGLGLTICRRLVELMDGQITVNSTLGTGSCFKVILPLEIVQKSVSEEISSNSLNVSWDGPPLRILFAEDNPVNITIGMSIMKKLGFEVSIARNGIECLEKLEQSAFDLVLMDIQMPEMNGEKALQEIRRREQGNIFHQPVIALTAYALCGEMNRFLAEGFDGYVSKPIEIMELLSEIKRVLDK